jgi:hypothetical protein
MLRSLLLTLATVLTLATGPAQSAELAPYGGCDEAWQAPQSDGADWCRDHGWTVTGRLVIGPRAVVRYSSLPHCRVEDASRGPVPCTWNVGPGVDGNGVGLAFVSHDREAYRYVWPESLPANNSGWGWLTRYGQRVMDRHAGQRDERAGVVWRECVMRMGPTTVTKCPNGFRVVS